jgi:hypothetical protein
MFPAQLIGATAGCSRRLDQYCAGRATFSRKPRQVKGKWRFATHALCPEYGDHMCMKVEISRIALSFLSVFRISDYSQYILKTVFQHIKQLFLALGLFYSRCLLPFDLSDDVPLPSQTAAGNCLSHFELVGCQDVSGAIIGQDVIRSQVEKLWSAPAEASVGVGASLGAAAAAAVQAAQDARNWLQANDHLFSSRRCGCSS